jgi:DNA-binding PadR family transcriptional regulator
MGSYFRGHGRTARRGDVRASILALLAERPMHGYQVIQELETRSEGRWRPSAGSVYPTLQQLEDEGLVRSEERDGRRVFSLTDAADAELARRPETSGAPWESMGRSEDSAFELRSLSFQLGAAAMQVAQVGSARSIDQARDVLVDARRRLYRLLAEDETAGPRSADAPGDD